MNKDGFFYLGKILKTYGSKGHFLVFLDVDDPGKYKKTEMLFVRIEEDLVPFPISEFSLKPKSMAVIRLDDVYSADDADIYSGREVYLPISLLPQLKGKKFYFHEVVGFTVLDTRHGNIGTLKSILDLPQQPLMEITFGSKEILIPLVDEILSKVDRQKKEIHITAPEGLIEIYL